MIQVPVWITRGRVIAALWTAMGVAVFAMACTGPRGWDAAGYGQAIETVRHGGDPYAAGIAAQLAFHDHPAAGQHVPWNYLYSPMTLLLLRLLGQLPDWLLGALYGLAVAAGALLALRAGYEMADEGERRWLAFVLPVLVFFPGLVTDDAILSGNIAYVLYGAVLAGAVPGWKRGQWFWYYCAVLAASVFKAPMLSLLVFPVLVGRRQWLPAGITGAAGLLLFGAQARIWPELFREYLRVVQLQFDWSRDFGFGPAGELGRLLAYMGLPHSPTTTICYLIFVLAMAAALIAPWRRVQQGCMAAREFVPVAIVATLLCNPHVMKYDLAAFTVPMLLIGWRALGSAGGNPEHAGARFWRNSAVVAGLTYLLVANVITVTGPQWSPVELAVLLAAFGLGIRLLYLPVYLPASEETPVVVPAIVD